MLGLLWHLMTHDSSNSYREQWLEEEREILQRKRDAEKRQERMARILGADSTAIPPHFRHRHQNFPDGRHRHMLLDTWTDEKYVGWGQSRSEAQQHAFRMYRESRGLDK